MPLALTANPSGILIIEDTPADVILLKRTISQAGVTNPIQVLRSGSEAIEYLGRKELFQNDHLNPFPRIVFLDLKMPPPDGIAILRWKETQSHLPKMLWVAISHFDSSKAIKEAYETGANTFLSKPIRSQDVLNLVQSFKEYWIPGSDIHSVGDRE